MRVFIQGRAHIVRSLQKTFTQLAITGAFRKKLAHQNPLRIQETSAVDAAEGAVNRPPHQKCYRKTAFWHISFKVFQKWNVSTTNGPKRPTKP
jgi:hypothetical protein